MPSGLSSLLVSAFIAAGTVAQGHGTFQVKRCDALLTTVTIMYVTNRHTAALMCNDYI